MGAFISPLHLIPEADHDGLTDQYIKRLRKELLLRFELENQTEISVNGLLYDKDRVIKIIEELRSNRQEHIWLFQQTSLLAFLEKQELQFFANPKDWQSLDHADFGGWLWPYFSSQLRILIFKLVVTKEVSSTRTLKQIFDYDFHLSGDRADDVYQSAFAELMRFIQGAGKVSALQLKSFTLKANHQYSYAMRSNTIFSFEDETFRIKHQGITYTLADITQQQTSFFLRPNIWRNEKTTDFDLGTFKKISYLDDFGIRKEGPITFYFDAQNKFPYCVERQWYALSSIKNGNS